MVQQPMFKSRAVAQENPSSSCKTVLILGIGKGVLTILLFTSQKLLKKHTVPFFIGTINDGKAHSDSCCRSSTPSLHSLSVSLMRTYLCIFGTGNARPWYGFEPSFNSLTPICLLAGTKNYPSIGFLRRNSMFYHFGSTTTTHKQHHHGELPPPPMAWL